MNVVQCKLVETQEEMEQAYGVRREIFVKEQKLFAGSDRDEYDSSAIHIVALLRGEIIGTVRVYEREEHVWFGSRLAVLKPFRGRVGKVLIQKAVEVVKKKKAKRFMAYVQLPNVPFFRRHRWRSVGDVTTYQGTAHQLMETQL